MSNGCGTPALGVFTHIVVCSGAVLEVKFEEIRVCASSVRILSHSHTPALSLDHHPTATANTNTNVEYKPPDQSEACCALPL
jgi:hypothetical protein